MKEFSKHLMIWFIKTYPASYNDIIYLEIKNNIKYDLIKVQFI